MEPPYRFQYIHIERCWPDSETLLRDYTGKITARGRLSLADVARDGQRRNSPILDQIYARAGVDTPDFMLAAPLLGWSFAAVAGTGLNTLGLLQVALLCTSPFQRCADDQLYDPRDIEWTTGQSPVFPCPDRPFLLEKLAQELLGYEVEMQISTRHIHNQPLYMQQALEKLTMAARLYKELYRRRGGLPQKPVAPDRVDDWLSGFARLLTVLTPVEYRKGSKITQIHHTNRLTEHMLHAFRSHVPREYTESAMLYSIAEILKSFGMEEGTNSKQIAERLRKRLERAQHLHP